MKWKLVVLPVLVVLAGAVPVCAQVSNAGYEGKIPVTVGVGMSDYLLDWGQSRRMIGVSAWADWRFRSLPGPMSGLGLEITGHHIAYDRPDSLHKMQQDTGLIGPYYQVRKWQRVHPYVKYLIGIGSIDFDDTKNPYYTHDTRTVLAPAGGVDVRAWGNFYVRADYEYQYWRQIFGPHDLSPNGVTVGLSYDFGGRPR